MLRHYIRMAFRHLSKDRMFSAINVFGLASGLAVCLLISKFVIDEMSYDKFNNNAERIYRVASDIHINGNGIKGNFAPAPLGPTMLRDFPNIENFVRIRKIDRLLVNNGKENILEPNAVFADSTLFDVFSLPMLVGNPNTALIAPYSMVISETIAKKYFNSINVLGKLLMTDNEETYTITGVIKDIPAQSHFHFDFIKAMSEKKNLNGSALWLNPHSATYLLAKANLTTMEIDKMLALTISKYVGAQLKNDMHSSFADLAAHGDYFRYYSMPLTLIHLHSKVTREFEANTDVQLVKIFMVIASLILLIACFNYINLSTARSIHRAKDVGVRKILGSFRSGLIRYFLVESILTSLFATLFAVLMTILLIPYFNQLTGKHFTSSEFLKKEMIYIYFVVGFSVGLIAGSYPAFYLSAFKPIEVLNNKLRKGFSGGWLRNSLVVFQFSIAIFLIVATLVIKNQLDFIKNRDLGYNGEQILTVSNTNYLGTEVDAFKNEVSKLQGVLGSTMTGSLPNKILDLGGRGYFKDATQKATQTFLLASWIIDVNYVPLLKMKMVGGRNFSPFLKTDSSGVLINETAANLLGYAADPIDKPLYISGSNPKNPPGGFRILGVVKDFNAGTLHEKIGPIVFHLGEDKTAISFKLAQSNVSQLVPIIKKTYQSLSKATGQPFTYSFMNDDFNNLYQSDIRVGKTYLSFTIFAILIACLGLFGLTSYTVERRIKEIGLRKVLGASTPDIVGMISKGFLKLIFIALIIACPLAWWLMHKWLENFAYRTDINWVTFAGAAILALLVSGVTIGFQSIKIAFSNPTRSLRTE